MKLGFVRVKHLKVSAQITATALAIFTFALGVVMFPSLAFDAGVVAIEPVSATNALEYQKLSADVRLAIASHYFDWAVVTIAICGAVVWRFPRKLLTVYTQVLLASGFSLSALSLVVGAGFLEVIAFGFAHGFQMLSVPGVIENYPDIQLWLLVSGFLFAALAAIKAELSSWD